MSINLFEIATSELSQDAFLAWLLSWSSPQYSNEPMYSLGKNFLDFLLSRKSNFQDVKIKTISVHRQYARMDVLCKINEDASSGKCDAVIVIEDKRGSSVHGDQLERYKETALRLSNRVYCFYIQTLDESQTYYSEIESKGYSVVLRKDLLDFFEANSVLINDLNNEILNDYVDYLKNLEADALSYLTRPCIDGDDQWTWNAWQGFYRELQQQLMQKDPDASWSYVANPSGGFLGIWWHFMSLKQNNGHRLYLQLEMERLCFKIESNTPEEARMVMFQLRDGLIEAGEKSSALTERNLKVKSPNRLRAGTWTTVAIIDNYRALKNGEKIIDLGNTITNLKIIQNFLDDTAKIF